MPDAPSQTVVENIDHIVRSETALSERRSLGQRLGHKVGGAAGTLGFVAGQLALLAAWVAANAGLLPGVPAFDPYPYGLLGTLMSAQGVLLACLVLIKQAHESRLSERRSHLALHVNLLAEKEVTKLIQMIERMSAAEGTQARVTDAETRELGQVTAVGQLARELDRRLDAET